ncbi:MAG: DNA polymerase III subunit gamma/tau [Oscillospiraceae bacterium]|nr:DNA polymerase III subunit gamma/tau [Oscillospiraceae bacterium]
MYQALYRKWRPKAFADVVGQEHITQTLRRQAAQGRLSHAYLFTGTRGTGKTTCAKILAKAVNCQHPVDGDPCNQCQACLGIDNGSLLDVLELDAASNNGVDHVRALRDEAIYSPASVRYRVYIVDEVHMLSTAAFNALLKILEEPPAHLIFILATTELHKVPATILSRCQRFAFRRIRPQDIAQRLRYVAGQEGMALDEDAAELLARLSDGALRDALSLLDQCGASGGAIDTGRVLDVLGLAGNVQTAELMGCVLRREVKEALLLLDRLYRGGKDVGALLSELSTLTRDLLIRMTAPEGGAALLSGGYDSAQLDSLSQGVNPTRLIYMATQLQTTAAALPLSANRRTDAELCLMRLCDEGLCGDVTALAARLARLEEGGAAPVHPAPPRPASVKAQAPPPQDPPPWDEDPAPIPDAPPWEEPDGPPPYGEPVRPAPAPERQRGTPPPQPQAASGGDTLWRDVAEVCKNQLTPMYWFMLDDTSGTLEGDTLTVRCGDELTKETLDTPDISAVIRTAAAGRLGRSVAVRFALGGGEAPAAADKLEDLIRQGSKYDSFTVK